MILRVIGHGEQIKTSHFGWEHLISNWYSSLAIGLLIALAVFLTCRYIFRTKEVYASLASSVASLIFGIYTYSKNVFPSSLFVASSFFVIIVCLLLLMSGKKRK